MSAELIEANVVSYRTQEGVRVGILFELEDQGHAILLMQENGLRVENVNAAEKRYTRPIGYDLGEAVSKFLQFARTFGSQGSTEEILEQIGKWAAAKTAVPECEAVAA